MISPGGSSDASSSAKFLLQIIADNLFIINDDRLVVDASATETLLSDHDLVYVMLSENHCLKKSQMSLNLIRVTLGPSISIMPILKDRKRC